jgi:hypothetical protein
VVNKTAGEWITKMEGLVAMWEKQAATAEKVVVFLNCQCRGICSCTVVVRIYQVVSQT